MQVVWQGGCISIGRECAVTLAGAWTALWGSNLYLTEHVRQQNMCMETVQ